jgi:hypothetical protein
MNPADLSQLRDIHLPGAIAWWPPAPGWWILLGLALLALGVLWWRHYRRFRERAALRGLQAITRDLAAGTDPVVCIQRISMILRRFAMSLDAPLPVAGLTGEGWLRFLDSRWGRDEFSAGVGRVLIFGPYAPPGRVSATDVGALGTLCIDWIRAQRPPETQ